MDTPTAGKEIRRAVDTGKVIFGVKESAHALRHGDGMLLVMAQNTPSEAKETLAHLSQLSEIPLYIYEGTGMDLGNVCGKPYVVSTLLVEDAGKSKVMDVLLVSTEEKTTQKGKKKGSR
ncbi:MAG: 50S ribosomal protein L30e [archaeon]